MLVRPITGIFGAVVVGSGTGILHSTSSSPEKNRSFFDNALAVGSGVALTAIGASMIAEAVTGHLPLGKPTLSSLPALAAICALSLGGNAIAPKPHP